MDGQREHRLVARENGGRAVAVVHVTVDHHRSLNQTFLLHFANSYRNVVNRAESLTVPRECVVESAADIESDPIVEREAGGQRRAARCQPKRLHHFLRVRNFEPENFQVIERPLFQTSDPTPIVDQ